MRISNLSLTKNETGIRASARVEWEDCERTGQEVFIETEKEFEKDISLNPHSFLIGCILPALKLGEKRISIEGRICPALKEGLETVVAVITHWNGRAYGPIDIECKIREEPSREATTKRHAGIFLSGGIDSLASLRTNKLNYPDRHPGVARDCLFVHGFDIGGVKKRGAKYHVFERAKKALKKVSENADTRLIPVYTNIRHLYDEREFWQNDFFGAVLASVAHCFDSILERVYIASSYDIPNLSPCGSHPLIDPEYSSYELRIIHRDLPLSRLEKLRIVAGWDEALQNLRVCLANVPGSLNCGKCEKCVRTMTGLLAIGALDRCGAFAENDVTPEHFEAFKITIRHREPFYRELIRPLKDIGRKDLVDLIEKKLCE